MAGRHEVSLEEAFGKTAVGADRWVHHDESGLSLDDFQDALAMMEDWESTGRIEILDTREESETGRGMIIAVRFRRLK
jgi:hypothetical protein